MEKRSPGPAPQPQLEPTPDSPARSYTWLVVLIVVAAVVALYLVFGRPKTKPTPIPPPTQISPVTARKGDIGVYVQGLGSVVPIYTVTLTSQVNGQVREVHYKEGQMVHSNDSLVDINPAPFLAQLTAAQGQLERDKAVLQESEINLERYREAYASNAIPKQQLDDQQATVHQNAGTVMFDQGTVSNAQVQVDWCHITSPINGRVGLRLVDPGNVVNSSPGTPLVSITELQPITVIFSVAQGFLPEIQQQLREGNHLTVDAYDQLNENKLATGNFLAIDNLIDTNTGSIRIRSVFSNEDNSLFPNQFVNAHLLVQTIEGATLVPTEVIQRNGQEAFVYVVQKEDTNQIVAMKPVKVGVTSDDTTAVEGIEPGDVLAGDNFNRLQDKAKVRVRGAGQGAGGSGRKKGGNGQGKKSDGGTKAEQNE